MRTDQQSQSAPVREGERERSERRARGHRKERKPKKRKREKRERERDEQRHGSTEHTVHSNPPLADQKNENWWTVANENSVPRGVAFIRRLCRRSEGGWSVPVPHTALRRETRERLEPPPPAEGGHFQAADPVADPTRAATRQDTLLFD